VGGIAHQHRRCFSKVVV
jgi:hypothetical protein